MQIVRIIKRAIGLITFVALIAYFTEILRSALYFATEYLSADKSLSKETTAMVENFTILMILLALVVSVVYSFGLMGKIKTLTDSFLDKNKVLSFFVKDDACPKVGFSYYTFFITIVLCVLLHLHQLTFGDPKEEGFIEGFAALFFLVASVVFLITSFKIKKSDLLHLKGKKATIALIALSLVSFYIFGEEISWGQHIFGWDSFGIFEKYNFQAETNMHNFLNPIFNFVYPFIGMCMFICMFLIWFFPKTSQSYLFSVFSPHRSLFFLFLYMACSTFYGHSEIFEILLSIFFLCYAFRMYFCLENGRSKDAGL
ncbi:hypothetical protein [Spongiimicrobium sp. 3-5]|uniref:hypothetical protein n=1 Tax=Spongiimicrobium sp. 3-5 TaxID=3332596 RepID=UPI00398062F9